MKILYSLYCFLFISLTLHANPTALEFIENKGQWKGPFKYKAAMDRGLVFLQQDGFTYLLEGESNGDLMDAYHHGQITQPPVLKFHAYKVTFLNCNHADITGGKQENTTLNYFLGNDTTKWVTNLHPCQTIDYNNLYNGINMHISNFNQNMKYEFVVQPGANVEQLRLKYEGADKVYIRQGNLIITTSVGDMTELKPYVYQYINDSRVQVPCQYKIRDNIVTYDFPDDYDHSQPLIIDPTVVFATYTGSKADNWGFTATYDEHGNFYAGGIANDFGFPVSTGAFQTSFAGGRYGGWTDTTEYAMDVSIIKYNPTGTSRIWATYLGGADNESPHSMIVDSSDNLIIAGRTYSNNFPVTTGAYQRTFKGGKCDMFVTKLSANGSSLLGSTYIGGSSDDGMNFDSTEYVYGNLKHNYGDDARSEVQIDKAGNVYVTASTYSTDFPVTSGAYQTTKSGGEDAVVFKMNASLTSLIWSTYLGGTNDDAGYVLAFDNTYQHLYVAGGTQSSNFPAIAGTLYPTYQGGAADGFILKFLNSSPYTLQEGTFIGTTDYDQVYGVQVDQDNSVYAVGQSIGGHFPVTSGVYNNPHSCQFIIKLDSNLKTNVFSTVFGSGDSTHTNISPVAFLVDTCQNIYISGWGGNLFIGTMPSSVGTTDSMPITADAAQPTTDGRDFYFIVLSKDASSLLYATYMGENGGLGEHVDGGTSRFDKYGIVYQAICGGCGSGSSSTFPTTTGVWSPGDSSDNCNEIALKIAFELGDVVAKAKASPNTKGCLPFTVHFLDSSINATSYHWDFGDGTIDTTRYPTHTFTSGGVFTVHLAIYNPRACKERDTVKLTITVDTTFEHPAFTYTVQDSCGPYIASFANTSVYSSTPGSSSFTRFYWDFGDGTSYTGVTPSSHTFAGPGLYTVMLVMIDSTACNSPDTVRQTLRLNSSFVRAGFLGPDSICKGASATFTDSSINATGYSWHFGDGGTASSASPSHEFDSVGTFIVTFVASNPNSCNGADTVTKTIKVLQVPTADFTYSPLTPVTNVPTTFTNLSVNALTYLWRFGDGAISTDVNPIHFYKKTGTYNVCLTARNTSGCPSTLCRQVSSDVRPLADLPTAFSPNGDGANDILYVRGAAIQTLDLQIYNRWGEMVFESKDLGQGWDGTFNGKPQPMDAYAYVLRVTFIDGTTLQKKGNVTLLR